MNPEDTMPDAAKETIDQANAVEKQMTAEAAAAAEANAEPAVDNSIISDDVDSNYKPLSEIAAAKPDAPSVDPTVLVTDAPTTPTEQPKKIKNKRIPIIIGLIVGVILLLGIGIWVLVALLSHDSGGAVAEEGKIAFAIESEKRDGSFAIFNNDGKQLTDFIYGEVSDFKNGYAVVQDNSKTKYAIITNTGKLSVPFEKYKNITLVGSLFSAEKDGEIVLLNGKGEEIMPVSKTDSANGLTIAYSGNIATVFDGNGEKLGEMDANVTIGKKTKEDYVAIYLDKTNFIIRTADGTVRSKYESSERHEVREISKDGNIIIACATNSCKIIFGDKAYDWDRTKYGYVAVASSYNGGNYVYGTNKDDRFYMTEEGVLFQGPYISGYTVIHDSKHYAYIEFDNTVATIVAGEETIKVNGIRTIDRSTTGYILSFQTYSEGSTLYNKDGKEVFNHESLKQKDIKRIDGPDKNGLYIVNYSILMDKNLKMIGSKSSGVLSYLDGNYLVSNYDHEGIYSPEGKTIIDSEKCKEIEVVDSFYLCTVGSKKHDLYSHGGKRILEDYESIKIVNGHIEADNGATTEYYTLDGEMFYEA